MFPNAAPSLVHSLAHSPTAAPSLVISLSPGGWANFEWCVYKPQLTNPTHSAFKGPNVTMSTPCDWLVHVKGSAVNLGQAVEFGHNGKKNSSERTT